MKLKYKKPYKYRISDNTLNTIKKILIQFKNDTITIEKALEILSISLGKDYLEAVDNVFKRSKSSNIKEMPKQPTFLELVEDLMKILSERRDKNKEILLKDIIKPITEFTKKCKAIGIIFNKDKLISDLINTQKFPSDYEKEFKENYGLESLDNLQKAIDRLKRA